MLRSFFSSDVCNSSQVLIKHILDEKEMFLKSSGGPPKPHQPQHILGQILTKSTSQPHRELHPGAGSTFKIFLDIYIKYNLPES